LAAVTLRAVASAVVAVVATVTVLATDRTGGVALHSEIN